MTCIHPLTLKRGRGWYLSQVVPCGRCISCKINRAEDWAHRMRWERDYFDDVSFVTLTYSDDFLPLDRSVDKYELQCFFKRLRKELGDRKIKYFACGEYGEEGGRPHYHAVIFGIACDRDSEAVRQCWGKGNVSLSVFTSGRALYCAGYLLKEVDSRVDLRGCTPPFALMSKKLGLRFAEANLHRVFSGKLSIDGSPVAVPRYFRKKFDRVSAFFPDTMGPFLREQQRVHLERIGGWKDKFSALCLEESLTDVRNQVALNQKGKESVKRGTSNGL